MQTETISREAAIARLRKALIGLAEEGKSMCRIAAEKNILCGGFHRYIDEDLRRTYRMLDTPAGTTPRAELAQLANDWQLARDGGGTAGRRPARLTETKSPARGGALRETALMVTVTG